MLNYPLISVVVPIYNVENYLKRCIDSICQQTYSNLDIILVDDGSTDNCKFICDIYQEKDNRVRVIHKKNGGLSDARNVGIRNAKGEYVTCIDSDDFVSPLFLENLWNAVKKSNCEIATSWFVKYYKGDNIPKAHKVDIKDINILTKEKFYEKLFYQDGVEISAWGKLYKKSLFQGVEYPIGKLYEDIATTYLLIEKVNQIAVIPNVDYYYYQRNTSIAKSNFSLKKMQAIEHMFNLKEFIIKKYPMLKKAVECRYFCTICNILFQIKNKKYKKQRRQLWSELKKYRYGVLTDRKGRKKARLASILSYGGYNFMSFIYSMH